MYHKHLVFLFVLSIAMIYSPAVNGQYENKSLEAVRCDIAPKIDGSLDDVCWMSAPKAKGFVEDKPDPGTGMSQETEVQIVYDDEAMYIAFMNYDSAPDSILQQLSGRDSDGNSDYVAITFSCYRDGINGLTFATTPTGEQWDARESGTFGEDVSWNGVWDCRAKIVANGWIAEFKIPFAAIRFPDKPEQLWDINFVREVRRFREHGFWRGVDPEVPGYLTQMGTLTGIKNITPPKRIFLYPYASYYENFLEIPDNKALRQTAWNAGLDVKIGLNDAFTLDATLVPDFGQVISDQRILNLTPFEVQFQDNRQFFIEGTELFSKGGLFYSRRVGYLRDDAYRGLSLSQDEYLKEGPQTLQLLNASKVSGRNSKGLGIGVFNAVTDRAMAIVGSTTSDLERSVEINPVSNYSVIVLDQNLKNNSYVSLINTNVLRIGEAYDANVIGTEFDLRDKRNKFSITGGGAYNRKTGGIYKNDDANDDGYTARFDLNKIDGNWRFSAGTAFESDTYDPRDLGFLFANNSIENYLRAQYRVFKPFWRINNMNTSLSMNYNRLYNPGVFTDVYLQSTTFVNTRSFTTYFLNVNSSPIRGYDYFEPRTDGRYFRTFSYVGTNGWISTDYRKVVALDVGGGIRDYENEERVILSWNVSPRWRVNDHLMLVYNYDYEKHTNDVGYATQGDLFQPIFGRRDVTTHATTLSANYAFNPFMTLNCRVRYYWGFTKYKEFYDLAENGEIIPSGFAGFVDDSGVNQEYSGADQSFASFTIDMFYRWIFVPGSELSIVWKNDVSQYDRGKPIPSRLVDGVDYTFAQPQNNNISIKVLYFLDYRSLMSKKNRA